ncbi:MAG TPA: GTP cyclohydrolase II [Myxococcales bacterium]|nr:GTP cyclohydrolase II [Myxococcales bacterium]
MPKSATARRVAGKEAVPYAETLLPTRRGEFRLLVFQEPGKALEHVALVRGDPTGPEGALVRVHSECLTGEVFGSLRCDCRDQLDWALDRIAREGKGVLVYLRQEGRGIGLGNKIRAYALQAQGLDTFDANRRLGFPDDLRHYDYAAAILRYLGVGPIDLLTNNPRKVEELGQHGIEVRSRVAVPSPVTPHNHGYLQAKKRRSGHLIDL